MSTMKFDPDDVAELRRRFGSNENTPIANAPRAAGSGRRKAATVQLNVRVSRETKSTAEALAVAQRRSLADVVELALADLSSRSAEDATKP